MLWISFYADRDGLTRPWHGVVTNLQQQVAAQKQALQQLQAIIEAKQASVPQRKSALQCNGKAVRACTGKPVEYTGDQYVVLRSPLRRQGGAGAEASQSRHSWAHDMTEGSRETTAKFGALRQTGDKRGPRCPRHLVDGFFWELYATAPTATL